MEKFALYGAFFFHFLRSFVYSTCTQRVIIVWLTCIHSLIKNRTKKGADTCICEKFVVPLQPQRFAITKEIKKLNI